MTVLKIFCFCGKVRSTRKSLIPMSIFKLSTALLAIPSTVFASEDSASDWSRISTPRSAPRDGQASGQNVRSHQSSTFKVDNWRQGLPENWGGISTLEVYNPCAANFEFFNELSSRLKTEEIRGEYNIHIHGPLQNIQDLEILENAIKTGYFSVRALDFALFFKPDQKSERQVLLRTILGLNQPYLKELSLRFCGLTDQEVRGNALALISKFPNLEKLSFAFNDLTENFMIQGGGFDQFGQRLESLNSLNLRGNRIGDDHIYDWHFRDTLARPDLLLDFNPISNQQFGANGVSTMNWRGILNKTWTSEQREFWMQYLIHQDRKSNFDKYVRWESKDRLPLEDWYSPNGLEDPEIMEDFAVLVKHSPKIGRFKQINATNVRPRVFDRFLELLNPNILHLITSNGFFSESSLNCVKEFRNLRVLDLSGSNITNLDNSIIEGISYPHLQQLVWQRLNFEDNKQFCFIFQNFLGRTAEKRFPKLRVLDFGESSGLSIAKTIQIITSLLPPSLRTLLLHRSSGINNDTSKMVELIPALQNRPLDFLDLTQSLCVSDTGKLSEMSAKIENATGLKTVIGLTQTDQNIILVTQPLSTLKKAIDTLQKKFLHLSRQQVAPQAATWTDENLSELNCMIGQIDPLSVLPVLVQSGLKGQNVSDMGIEIISRIKGLIKLDLEYCKVSDSKKVNQLIDALSPHLMYLNLLGQDVCLNSSDSRFEYTGQPFKGFILNILLKNAGSTSFEQAEGSRIGLFTEVPTSCAMLQTASPRLTTHQHGAAWATIPPERFQKIHVEYPKTPEAVFENFQTTKKIFGTENWRKEDWLVFSAYASDLKFLESLRFDEKEELKTIILSALKTPNNSPNEA